MDIRRGMISVKARGSRLKITKVLVVIIGIIYISFLYMDITNRDMYISSNKLKFISIILIFIISIIGRRNPFNYKDIYLLQAGLFITIFADLFLLILDNHYILGIILFSIVQILYSIRYDSKNTQSSIRKFIIVFILLSIIYIIANQFVMEVDLVLGIGLYYAICLLTSVKKAINAYRHKLYPSPNRQMIVLGMILFLLCDINVALYNIIRFIRSTGRFTNLLYNVSFVSMWLFYLPSQVLLSLSGYEFRENHFIRY